MDGVSLDGYVFPTNLGLPPAEDIIELTVFGPSYGEAIVLHLPGVGWGVIDSCTFKSGGKKFCLPLSYLQAFNVPRLDFVLLTHPHEDHYLGLDDIIKAYPDLRMVGRYHGNSIEELKAYWAYRDFESSDSSLAPLAKVLNAIRRAEKTGTKFIKLSEMQCIIHESGLINGTGFNTEIRVLSPSGVSEERYADALRRCIPRVGKRLRYLRRTDHNLIASALLVKVNDLKIILGSDVEKGGHNQTGWKGIMGITTAQDMIAQGIKVAHHGSSGAHHQPAWSLHKQAGPLTIITPYFKGSQKLPGVGDLARVKGHSKRLGITGEVEFDHPTSAYPISTVTQAVYDFKSWRICRNPENAGFLRIRYDLSGNVVETHACPPSLWL